MKKTILSGMAATIMLAACQQNEVLVDPNGGSTGSNSEAISFGLPLPDNGSRTALSASRIAMLVCVYAAGLITIASAVPSAP